MNSTLPVRVRIKNGYSSKGETLQTSGTEKIFKAENTEAEDRSLLTEHNCDNIGEDEVTEDWISDDSVKEEKDTPCDLYTLLITKAPYIPGIQNDLDPLEEIPWVDKSLIESCFKFHRKYLTFVILANTFSLMFGFCVKPNSAVVLRTGKLHDPELSFKRYLSTIQRIGKFFMLPADKGKAYKALDTVRKMHAAASKRGSSFHPTPDNLELAEPWKKEVADALRKDLGHIDTSAAPKEILTWDPLVPVSQFDMAMTQFGFIGTLWLFPRVFGIENRDEEMKGVIHMWAIMGRLLGIRDEFNVCIKPDAQLYEKLYRNVILDSLKTVDETVITIQSTFVKALNDHIPFLIVTYKAMLHFGMQDVEEYKGENLWKIMSWRDKLSYKMLQLWFWSMRCSMICRVISHFMTAMWLQFQFKRHLPTSLWD